MQSPISIEVVQHVFASLPRGSAHDTLGYTYELMRVFADAGCMRQIARALVHLSEGCSIPDSVLPHFAGGELIALVKKLDENGKVVDARPLAMGIIIRKLVSRCYTYAMKEVFAKYFSPIQFGVGIPGGTYTMVHRLSTLLAAHPDWAACTVDAANAFNSVSRASIYNELMQHFPELVPFFDMCYRVTGKLRVRMSDGSFAFVDSCDGCQQGDPLGPILFCCSIHPSLMKAGAGDVVAGGYIDDIALAGPKEVVATRFAMLRRRT